MQNQPENLATLLKMLVKKANMTIETLAANVGISNDIYIASKMREKSQAMMFFISLSVNSLLHPMLFSI